MMMSAAFAITSAMARMSEWTFRVACWRETQHPLKLDGCVVPCQEHGFDIIDKIIDLVVYLESYVICVYDLERKHGNLPPRSRVLRHMPLIM